MVSDPWNPEPSCSVDPCAACDLGLSRSSSARQGGGAEQGGKAAAATVYTLLGNHLAGKLEGCVPSGVLSGCTSIHNWT